VRFLDRLRLVIAVIAVMWIRRSAPLQTTSPVRFLDRLRLVIAVIAVMWIRGSAPLQMTSPVKFLDRLRLGTASDELAATTGLTGLLQ
jgi:hypothetical protein